MNNAEYIETQTTIINICVDVNNLKLKDFLEKIDETETVVPCLYLKGEKDLRKIKRLAQSILALQCSIRSILSGGDNA